MKKFLVLASVAMMVFQGGVALAEEKEQAFLVTLEGENPDPLAAPEEVASFLERVVAGCNGLAALQKEGKLTGGLVAGEKKVAFIVKAKSNEEVSQMLINSPFWGFTAATVMPLENFEFRAKVHQQQIDQMKKGKL